MTLFADDEPVRPTGRGRVRVGWLLTLVGVIGIVVFGFLPSPYVVELPGPVFDTLGEVTVSQKQVPMIDIPSATTYPTEGSLDMLTVSVDGSRESPLDWLDTATAWLDPSKAVVDVDVIYPQGETVEQSNQQSETDMQNSQQDAIAAALRQLGKKVPATITVTDVIAGEPAEGVLQKGDVIRTVGDQTPADIAATRAAIAKNGTSTPIELGITRDGKPLEVSLTPADYQGTPIVGVQLSVDYTFPIDVKIQLENVGGPSAGQMFALGIIDKLTEGSLTGGKRVAGTGTITASGEIGAIGGIRQKMYGAQRAGATYFLAPDSNCDEVVGHVPSGLTVFAVSTLSDSLADLKVVADGGDTSSLASCG